MNGNGGNVNIRSAGDPAYQRLLNWEHGTVDDPPGGNIVPLAFESWEAAADGLSYTFKLRPQKFDPRPPTNGRVATVQDVGWSLERYKATHPNRALLFNEVGEDAPLASWEFPDEDTIVMHLAFPTHYLLGIMATWLSPPYLMPVEAEEFDITNTMRGTGPFMLTEFEPDLFRKYDRNPNYWDAANRPFLDGLDYFVVPENAAWLAQFQAGRIWQYVPLSTEAVGLKKRNPEISLNEDWRAGQPGSGNTEYYMFSDLDGSIFRDERVRRAISMLLNRDEIINAVFNVDTLEADGVPMKKAWNGTANALWGEKWLDPQTGKLGEGSKYFEFNPTEAAKMLKAANAFGTTHDWTIYTNAYRGQNQLEWDVHNQMLQDDGALEINTRAVDLRAEFLPNYHFGDGQFEGMAFLTYGGYPSFGLYMWNAWMPSGRNAVRTRPISARIDELARRHRAEFDPEAQTQIEEEWQKEMAIEMPTVPGAGIATNFTMTQPWFGNGGVVKTWSWPTELEGNSYYYWFDASKA